jgi:hypothetical protein
MSKDKDIVTNLYDEAEPEQDGRNRLITFFKNMNISIAITQFFGILFVVMGLSVVVDRKGTTAVMQEMLKSRVLLWMGGLIALIMGAAFVVMNDTWTSGLPLLVTILGWLTLAKGCFILLFPRATAAVYGKFCKERMLAPWGVVCVVIGVVLLYLSFM